MGALTDRCAVCGKLECAFPARERDGQVVFDFGGGSTQLSEKQVTMLKSDHDYNERTGELGVRPIPMRRASVPPPASDWKLQVGMWALIALLLAMAWFGIGCGTTGQNILERTEAALRLLQCVESLPPVGSGVVSSAPPAAAVANHATTAGNLVDAGSPISRGIDATDPWWEPDASNARVEILQPGGE